MSRAKGGGVRINFEGGGDSSQLLGDARNGLARFLGQVFSSVRPRLIACGSRMNAYERFREALHQHPNDTILLLVDAEARIRKSPWTHVKERKGDGWAKPPGSSDENLHFMAQCMEAWFLADPDTLQDFYGQGFKLKALPANLDVEAVAKNDVFEGLRAATKGTKTKGAYGKSAHSFELLGRIDAKKVQARASHAKRLFETLAQLGMR